ncbi:hypothetical protein EYF80_052089 [Liparis tanakae]|uniref:Uncharacterized protein n=1 Tax=Liparis tanakae TaxID=230148 RepID=A0A4Z2F994_9TELE|nr:hypothetical protein EYF80_052089 [Liparis tanakae]
MSLVTLEPNVGPPGTQRLEGMQPEEELMSRLGQILARIEELNHVPQYPSEASTSEPQEPSDLRTSEVQEPSEVSTSEPSDLRGPGVVGPPRSRSRLSCRAPGPIGGRPTLVPRPPALVSPSSPSP